MYAYGIVFWEVLTAQRPWQGMLGPAIMMAVFMRQERPPLPPEIEQAPPGKLLKDCWAHDPARRPSFAKIVEAFETAGPVTAQATAQAPPPK